MQKAKIQKCGLYKKLKFSNENLEKMQFILEKQLQWQSTESNKNKLD